MQIDLFRKKYKINKGDNMNKINKIIFSLLIICLAFVLYGCKEESKELGYVVIETNPSIELVVQNDVVVSVNGLNDEGKMLIADEEFIDKKVEAAAELFISLSEKMGYTVKGEVSASSQEVKISVGGSLESDDLKILEMKVNESVETTIMNLGLNAKSTIVAQKPKEYFEKIAMKFDPTLTEEEAKAMEYKDLMNVVNLATLEKAEIVSVKLEEYYEQMKAYEFKLKYKQELAKGLGDGYQTLLENYNKLLTELTEAINALQTKKVEFFTSPDSPYVKAMEEYNKAKAEFLKTKIDVQIAVNNGEDVTVLNINLKLKEEAVKAVEKAIELAEAGIEATFDALIYSLEQVYKALEELEKEFPESINFEEKLTNAENYINGAKKEMFDKYESSVSKEKLDQMKANMKAQKEALKKTVEESKKAK